jgi:N-methylhydantoinase B/oxoprolinase/acetone carboxylase alpha subunit
MTTITIERELLDEVVELFDNAITARYPHEILRDLRAALAAPATAPDELERLKTESEERLQNCAALVAEVERLRKDAERYQWLAEYLVSDDESYDDAIVAATTVAELDYVTDAAMKGTP